MISSGSAVSAKGREPSEVGEHDRHLASVGPERVVGATRDDRLGQLRGEKPLETPQPLQLGDLLGDARFQRPVQLGQLPAVTRVLVVQALLLQAGADPRVQQHGVERLAEVILGAELDAADHALHVVQRRDHQDRDVAQRGLGLQPLEHGVTVEVGHHDVE
jgi:hypothetical protein